MRSLLAWPLIVAFSLSLTACVSWNPNDAVHDSATAIQAAKKLCDWKQTFGSERWHAQLRRDMWHVWLNTNYEQDKSAAILFVSIRASDGKSSGCPVVT